jgi:hypothetical protein
MKRDKRRLRAVETRISCRPLPRKPASVVTELIAPFTTEFCQRWCWP